MLAAALLSTRARDAGRGARSAPSYRARAAAVVMLQGVTGVHRAPLQAGSASEREQRIVSLSAQLSAAAAREAQAEQRALGLRVSR